MPKTAVCSCTEKTSKQQKSRCRSKRECKFPVAKTGRKPAQIKQSPQEIGARYDKSDKGKKRKARYRRKQWAQLIKKKVRGLPSEPRETHLTKGEGAWSPVPAKSLPMADPLPERKRGQLPEDFWEEVLKRRAALEEKRAAEEKQRSISLLVRCERCYWFKYCSSGYWKEVPRTCPVIHGPRCEYFSL